MLIVERELQRSTSPLHTSAPLLGSFDHTGKPRAPQDEGKGDWRGREDPGAGDPTGAPPVPPCSTHLNPLRPTGYATACPTSSSSPPHCREHLSGRHEDDNDSGHGRQRPRWQRVLRRASTLWVDHDDGGDAAAAAAMTTSTAAATAVTTRRRGEGRRIPATPLQDTVGDGGRHSPSHPHSPRECCGECCGGNDEHDRAVSRTRQRAMKTAAETKTEAASGQVATKTAGRRLQRPTRNGGGHDAAASMNQRAAAGGQNAHTEQGHERRHRHERSHENGERGHDKRTHGAWAQARARARRRAPAVY
ncbi:hypothetical protein BJ912DRAFT_1072168 [Pholiota molesta]|nr:hypothetical protein BJ912DRAFT_1072168 [Pholiota molesta]